MFNLVEYVIIVKILELSKQNIKYNQLLVHKCYA